MGKKRRLKTRRRKTTTASEQQTTELLSSAEIIGGNEDLLRNILINIPEKPLSRFKSVSKTWLSVISDPHFSLRWHTKHIPSPSALFCYAYNQYSFVPLDNREKNNSFDRIFNADPFPVAMHPYDRPLIYQSCNGLLLLTIRGDYDCNLPYPFPLYVYNPTTRQIKNIPDPRIKFSESMFLNVYLAFDPLTSSHFKIFMFDTRYLGEEWSIYSSETDSWRAWKSPQRDLFAEHQAYKCSHDLMVKYGVFFDGAIHWPTWFLSISVCFDIDEECCFQFPMPPIQGGKKRRSIRYFGESGGYLHLIDCKDSDLRFRGYKVDLVDALGWRFIAFGWDIKRFNVVILGLIVHGKDSSVLVMHVPAGEMAISYNMNSHKLKKLCPLLDNHWPSSCIGGASMVHAHTFGFRFISLELDSKKHLKHDNNPGRRFRACEQGVCGYFSWVDPPMCKRSKEIIPGLLRKKNQLEDEVMNIGGASLVLLVIADGPDMNNAGLMIFTPC
ncbi:hypothetical protein LguiA_018016 [Lonicera macranthoides]